MRLCSSNVLRDKLVNQYVFTQHFNYKQNTTQGRFKRSTAGFNIEFSSRCFAEVNEPSLPNYLPIVGWNRWIHTFPEGMSRIWNVINLVQDLNSGLWF